MTTAREQPLPPCEPGEEVELSLELTAPMTTGRHYGDWYLYDPDGNVFGEVIYLVIQARTPKEIANGRPDADFVADVTIPDDTVIPLGQPFKKIWRVRNTGNVTWGEGYSLVHTDGESMTDDTTVTVPTTRVGDTAEITIRFTAPAKAGRYYSDWRFHDGTDRIFGDIIHTRINAKPDENNIGINDSTVLKDVTIPDDTKLQPGETFTKTWLARNSGTKAWGEGYTLRFIEGNAMTTQTDVPLPAAKPGDEVMISVELTAPQTLGTHYCDWKMIDDQNRPFGDIFWARIVVPTRNGQEKPDELRPDSETDPVRTKPTQELQAPAPFFSQRDPRWAQNQLGNSPSQTIASWGCMMTCNAMILAARGFDTNPGDLNDLLRQRRPLLQRVHHAVEHRQPGLLRRKSPTIRTWR